MGIDDIDELELPRNRPTDPAPPMTEREMLESIQELLAGLAADIRALTATVTGAVEQGQSFNLRVSDLEQRVSKLESQRLNGGPNAIDAGK